MTVRVRKSAFGLAGAGPWGLLVVLGCNAPTADGLYGPGGEAGGAGGRAGSSGSAGSAGSAGVGGGMEGGGAGGAGAGGTGGNPELDAGGVTLDAAADASPDAESLPEAGPSCSGTLLFDICWHLGPLDASCEQACSPFQGYDPAATAVIGTPAQGGSLENCLTLLEALDGSQDAVISATQQPEFGVGCHTFNANDGFWWWLTMPAFSPSASLTGARNVCGCNE